MNRNTFKNLFDTNNIVLVFAIFVAASLVWNTMGAIDENFALQQKVDNLEDEVGLLELQNTNLALNNEYYKTDAFLELAARDKLNKVSPGEKVLVLPERERSPQLVAATQVVEQSEASNFEEWLFFLFGVAPE